VGVDKSTCNLDASQHIAAGLVSLGVRLNDENYAETPERFTAYLENAFSYDIKPDLEKWKRSTFPTKYAGMVTQTGIHTHSMCPHHLLPVQYEISLAYIPKERVIGLSKLARMAIACSKSPALQEDLAVHIAEALHEVLQTENVAVLVSGIHSCMTIRGVRARDSKTTTSIFQGDFYDDLNTRNEFLSLVRMAQ
jgi:GTP cyclohydrolase I